MTSYIRSPLVIVWALLTVVTVASWLTARDGGSSHQVNIAVTVVVLLIAALKTQLVIWHFMEVRNSPGWLRAVMHLWLAALFTLLLGVYFSFL
ncbi:cytochrome C oxidase subunit IV family protein [Mycolicibacterium austroafricanum]|uniref:Cytochrome C oxidase subunit IV family protein n=1 Tax=Mycolicibacterium austroafricanum TaxID=39687 RepID=A0ABT8H9R0_MYCAO|nr:cytochrome C oxidase subunit IV family protein [Mycolicibacterium austroafricanum]MDN4517506.1 cytochrome C oxidase subunit IV family protein [Mycolicibacterium austroafricanum]QRZ07534.1 cytochrome C oxidase subunit IV family protein [Mycolicibacterium austroafricanum]QZT69197.1 cytochrome C oxidase subunit IV family protein [Mycolicibacterium austroafricanum]